MTRVFTDGAETGNLDFWSGYSAYVGLGSARSGNYAYQISQNGRYAWKNFSDLSEMYVRYGIYINNTSVDVRNLFRNSTTEIAAIRFSTTTSLINLYVGGGYVTSGTHVIGSGSWYLIELYIKIADSGGIITVYVDGVFDAEYTGDTKPGAATTVNNIYFSNSNNVSYFIVDDLALNNINGSEDNSWCGDGHIEALIPNADGDLTQWNPSTGTTHYNLVDERPPSSSDYVYIQNNPGYQDMYNMSDYTSTNKLVKRIWTVTTARDTQAMSGGIKTGIKTSGCVVLSSASSVLGLSQTQVLGDEYTLNPVDGETWEEADLDAIQFVVEAET